MAVIMVVGMLPATALAAGKTLNDYFSGMPITAETEPGYPNSTKKWTVSTKDGGEVLKSASGMSRSSSTLQLTMKDTVNLSFEYKVSTEANYDKLTISNGDTKLVDGVSGLIDWTRLEIDARQGDVISIVYSKDYSGDDNDDCVYLRNFTCGAPVVVTLHANNGTDETATQNIYGGKGTLTANPFTNSGKVFAGWAKTADGEVVYAGGEEITVDENTDLYAVWGDAYTVTFDNDGVTSTVDVARDNAIGTTKMPKDPTKKGYTFEGWFNGEDKLTADTVITDDVTYTAKWTPIKYTIKFDKDAADAVGSMDDISATYDEEVQLPKCAFTREGYTFTGWGSYKNEDKVKNLASKDGANVTLKAYWQGLSVNITANLNYSGAENIIRTGAVGSNYNYIVKTDGGTQYSELKDPTRTGYLFDGWFDAAEGGNEITNQYKFTAEDAKNGKTLYAHWSEAVTITFDKNGGTFYYTEKKDIRKGTAYGSLPDASMSGKVFAGWYTEKDGGNKVEKDTIFNEDTTLYARYRNYQITVSFNANGGTGEMDKLVCESGVATKLPKCTFTREGYDFEKWSTSRTPSSYSTNYEDEADYVKTSTWRDDTVPLYALWKENISKTAIDAMNKVIPSDNIIRTETTLPTSGEGYTIAYASDSALISSDGKITLPVSGTTEIAVTATITDTATHKTYTKEYTLTLYSTAVAATEAELNKAVDALGTKNFMPVYGTDTNAITAVEKKLLDAGYEGITVSIEETVADSNNYASIDKDGTIHYFFNPSMTRWGGTFYTTFVLSKNGTSVEKKWYTSIDWDKAKVLEALNTVADTLTVPETATADMKLPAKANSKDWSSVKWVSSDAALKIGTVSYSTSTYPVTLNAKTDTTVVLTATVKCNNVDGVTVTRTFDCTVPAGSGAPAVNYQQKLDTALTETGLKDFVTGEKLTEENGVYTTINDIQFPTTRNLKIDGKYTPVVITSSDANVIETSTTPNSARVYVYRPLPGQSAKTVTLTMKILDRPNGPQTGDDLSAMPVLASKDIKVTVQPLTQAEIDAEVALMEQVKSHYWDGIRSANTDQKNVTTNMHAFQECYLDNGNLTWVYDYKDLKNHGIVPVDMDGWYDTQQWRLFRSSNAAVVSHENLLVTRSEDSKAVTITSWLSSETLGKYAEKYPNNVDFQKLYQQPVTVQLVVTGTKYAQGGSSTDRENAANDALNNRKTVTVKSFTLTGTGMGFTENTNLKYDEGSTVFDVFTAMLDKHGYTCKRKGSYIYSITSKDGKTLEEFDEGKNSGWMYYVNGELPDKYMSQYVLKGNETIEVKFIKDYTTVSGSHGGTVTPTVPTTPEEPAKSDLPFKDVSTTAWYYSAVNYAYLNKLLNGTSTDTFTPDGVLTRGMAVTVLYRLSDSPTVADKQVFTDVANGQWYANAVNWAADSDIVAGVGDNKFAPQLNITREQLATILYRYAKMMKYDETGSVDLSKYTDAASVSSWAAEAVQWAVANGLISGTSETTLSPNTTATRAQFAAIMQRFSALSTKK